jgi:hypothetical protein
MPLNHTLIIKANIKSSQAKNSNQKIDKHLRHQIITTCGDANAMMGTKHIDLSMCLYLGAYLMCIDNKHLKDKVPKGNGTLCCVSDVELKHNAPRVWTVNATDVECVECEHVNKTRLILQLETQIHDVTCQPDLATNFKSNPLLKN